MGKSILAIAKKMGFIRKPNLSYGVKVNKKMVSPSGEEAVIISINTTLGLSMLTTVIVEGSLFKLETRSPRIFDYIFK